MEKYKCIKECELPVYDEFEEPTDEYVTIHVGSIYEYSEGYTGNSDIRMYLEEGDDDFGFIDITYEMLENLFVRVA